MAIRERIEEEEARAGHFITELESFWESTHKRGVRGLSSGGPLSSRLLSAPVYPGALNSLLEVSNDETLALSVGERVDGKWGNRRLVDASESARVRRFLHNAWQSNGYRRDRYQGVHLPIPLYLREAIARAERTRAGK
jgi:hypothetical protein